ncbi:MAG TPA: DUF488 domain-containing protein [Saprospiraceae bacterium]|nr:DUF488 domain-containing protein [Saprospiraceae bacterium]HRO09112.1 DUF488 domain-containing protein [Saprospiraceae bacterium]HRO72639.1 DUF488 domain-containing protein [Saprospiraceae bacterium]HRP42474.1 DUF488 domain-containing protein [Saprospiraceae bacterium]
MKIKRIYEPVSPEDGYRILVDRIWPRGISKEMAALDEWDKDIAPSNELRKWFNHIPERFEAFKQKYITELTKSKDRLNRLRSIAKKQNLTLLYSAKDIEHNQAVVLMEILNNQI